MHGHTVRVQNDESIDGANWRVQEGWIKVSHLVSCSSETLADSRETAFISHLKAEVGERFLSGQKVKHVMTSTPAEPDASIIQGSLSHQPKDTSVENFGSRNIRHTKANVRDRGLSQRAGGFVLDQHYSVGGFWHDFSSLRFKTQCLDLRHSTCEY